MFPRPHPAGRLDLRRRELITQIVLPGALPQALSGMRLGVVASKGAVANPEKAAAITVYLKTLDEAYVWAATHTAAWATAWGKAAGLPASVMDVAAKVDATTPIPITPAITSSEQNLVDQFYAAGLIPNKVNISSYITTQFNATVSG